MTAPAPAFTPLGMGLGNLWRLSSAKTRSISAENPTGDKGKGALAEPDPNGPARELGRGWKCRPAVTIQPGEDYVLADISGPGALASMWFGGAVGRDLILRVCGRGVRPVFDAVSGHAFRATGRHVPVSATPCHVSVAHHGSGALRGRPESHHTGVGLAERGALSAPPRRYLLRGVLVSDAAHRPVSHLAGP